jgi:hypothetical protein
MLTRSQVLKIHAELIALSTGTGTRWTLTSENYFGRAKILCQNSGVSISGFGIWFQDFKNPVFRIRIRVWIRIRCAPGSALRMRIQKGVNQAKKMRKIKSEAVLRIRDVLSRIRIRVFVHPGSRILVLCKKRGSKSKHNFFMLLMVSWVSFKSRSVL